MYVGDMVTIIERGEEGGVLWLCLADGRGWAFERQGKRRVFSEVRYKAVSPEMTAKELMVCPRLEQDVELPDTPHIPLGAVGCSLAAGSVVRVLGHATVVLGTRSMKDVTGMFGGTEVGRTFYRVVNEKRLRGWIPATYTARDEDWTLIDFRYEHVSRSSDEVGAGVSAPPSGWASVVSSTRVPLCPLPGRSSTPTSRLEPGELLEVVGKLSAANLTFYRLQEGGWVCSTDSKGRAVVELVHREQHQCDYVCTSTYGTAVRHTPTRWKSQNNGTRITTRQQVTVSETVRFPKGDVFLHLQYPESGWVPTTTTAGKQKMVLVKRLYDDTPSGRVSEFVEIGSNELLPHELGGESNRASEASRTEHLEEPYPPASAGSGVSFSPRSGSFASFSAPVTPRATSFPPPPVSFANLEQPAGSLKRWEDDVMSVNA